MRQQAAAVAGSHQFSDCGCSILSYTDFTLLPHKSHIHSLAQCSQLTTLSVSGRFVVHTEIKPCSKYSHFGNERTAGNCEAEMGFRKIISC